MSTNQPQGQEVLGIDVSHHNGAINWKQVKTSPIRFAFMKASEGISFQDSQFRANWAGAHANGIARGAYHFFKPRISPIAQAEYFVQTVGEADWGGDILPPVLDIEVADGIAPIQLINAVEQFLSIVDARTGRQTMIYTGTPFWIQSLADSQKFASRRIWIAAYVKRRTPILPRAWGKFDIWQYTDKGRIAGIKTNCDLNRLHPSLKLADLLRQPLQQTGENAQKG